MSESEENKFIKNYFSTFDCHRDELGNMYDEGAYCSWRGNGLHGVGEIMKFFMALPFCKHVLHLLDVQPLTVLDGAHWLISAGGLVTYNDTKTVEFHKFMIVKKVDGNFIILNDSVYHSE